MVVPTHQSDHAKGPLATIAQFEHPASTWRHASDFATMGPKSFGSTGFGFV